MIQRIQSLLLLLAACAIMTLFVFPIAKYQGQTSVGTTVSAELKLIPESNPQMLDQITSGGDVVVDQASFIKVWPLTVLAVVVGLIALVSIFLYRNRMLQMRLVAVGFLLNVVYVFLVFFWAVDKFDTVIRALPEFVQSDLAMTYSLGTWTPIVSVVLLFFAQRAIKSDEAKVRAADRLR